MGDSIDLMGISQLSSFTESSPIFLSQGIHRRFLGRVSDVLVVLLHCIGQVARDGLTDGFAGTLFAQNRK